MKEETRIRQMNFSQHTPNTKINNNINKLNNIEVKKVKGNIHPRLNCRYYLQKGGEPVQERIQCRSFKSLVQTLPTVSCTTVAWQLLYFSIRTSNAIKFISIVISELLLVTLNTVIIPQKKLIIKS